MKILGFNINITKLPKPPETFKSLPVANKLEKINLAVDALAHNLETINAELRSLNARYLNSESTLYQISYACMEIKQKLENIKNEKSNEK